MAKLFKKKSSPCVHHNLEIFWFFLFKKKPLGTLLHFPESKVMYFIFYIQNLAYIYKELVKNCLKKNGVHLTSTKRQTALNKISFYLSRCVNYRGFIFYVIFRIEHNYWKWSLEDYHRRPFRLGGLSIRNNIMRVRNVPLLYCEVSITTCFFSHIWDWASLSFKRASEKIITLQATNCWRLDANWVHIY